MEKTWIAILNCFLSFPSLWKNVTGNYIGKCLKIKEVMWVLYFFSWCGWGPAKNSLQWPCWIRFVGRPPGIILIILFTWKVTGGSRLVPPVPWEWSRFSSIINTIKYKCHQQKQCLQFVFGEITYEYLAGKLSQFWNMPRIALSQMHA